jgi:ADP-ribose pyrophosphatase YjhB (NUDIX family)
MAENAPAAHRTTAGPPGAIRPIAAAVIRDGDRLLVWQDHDPATGNVVYVPLAGGIEFGETGAEAITRELQEEIGQTPARVAFLGFFEDIFDWSGQRRHELWLVYEVELGGEGLAGGKDVVVHEDDGTSYVARWRRLNELRGSGRLAPEGLLELIEHETKEVR